LRLCGAGGLGLQACAENTYPAWVDGTPAWNRRLVVIDDEARMRNLLKDLLTRKGYTVSVTADSKRGLTMLMRQAPDLVILGLKGSEMQGLDVLRRMKTHEEMMPVIVTTHPQNLSLAREGVRLGAFDYVLKPFKPAYMCDLVECALEQWHAA
jgi:DNA-binding NtrC family response regulator